MFRESALRATVNDLQEEFTHGSVDGIANEVGVESLVSGNTLLDSVHELAHVYELIATHLVVLVEEHLGDVTLGQLQVTGTLYLCAIQCTGLRNQALAQVLETSAHHEAAL